MRVLFQLGLFASLFGFALTAHAWEITTEPGKADQIGPHRSIRIITTEPPEGAPPVTRPNPPPAPIVLPRVIRPDDKGLVPDGMAIDLGNGEYLTAEGVYKDLGGGALLTPDGLVIHSENGAILTLPIAPQLENPKP
jgi:hypothetical protein